MKKHFTLFLIAFSVTIQKINAQLDMVFISNFSVSSDNSVNRLAWTVANNKGANRFEIERKTNGHDFETIAVLMATEKFGTENYVYSDTTTFPDKIMYRLRIISKNQNTFYSRIEITQSKIAPDYSIRILGNPARDRLSFNYTSKDAQQSDITIYNLCGRPMLTQKINSCKGNNFITIPLNAEFAAGMYVMKITNSLRTLNTAFIKQ